MKPFQCPECKAIITRPENARKVKGRMICRDCAEKLTEP
jgi:predicted RNA-binding Zn-ribbon protein involved in translation (DUF1610 family)